MRTFPALWCIGLGLGTLVIACLGCAQKEETIRTMPRPAGAGPQTGDPVPFVPIPSSAGCAGDPESCGCAETTDPETTDPETTDPETTDPEAGQAGTDSRRSLALHGSAPNPFNPATVLTFVVPADGDPVTLTIHSADGRPARQLVAARLPEGEHRVVWRGRDDAGRRLPSGVYLARLCSGRKASSRKLVLVQ